MKAKEENKSFYEVLDYYLEMIRKMHKRTYEYLGNMPASCNPLSFCEGGLWHGYLKPTDKIAPVLKQATSSFGITALNELEVLHSGKSILEDGSFSLEVMKYINDYVDRIKKEDGHLYGIYGTPAESLCGTQREQFVKKYGVIEGVSDRKYFSNSFHCHVSEDIDPITKQDSEIRFWNLFNGGKIQYCRYPNGTNKLAMRDIVVRGMDYGLYEGTNLSLCFCNECGGKHIEKKEGISYCVDCGSRNITEMDRVCGYLGYKEYNGDTRLNDAKLAEIEDRVSM